MTPAFSKTGRTNHLGVKLNKEQWRTESYPLQVIIANRRLLKWLQKDIKYYRSRNTFKHTNCTSNTELVVWTWSQYHLMVHFYDMQEPLECLSWSEVMEALCGVFKAEAPWSLSIWKLKVLVTSFRQPSESKQHLWCFIQHTVRSLTHTRLMCRQTKNISATLYTTTSYSIEKLFSYAHGYTLTEKSMFFLSWFTARGSGTGSVCLSTETDSPVKMDWSTLRVVDRMEVSLMSAGTLSPTAKKAKGSKSDLSYSGQDKNHYHVLHTPIQIINVDFWNSQYDNHSS